jgi:hypothetical protein
LVVDEKRRKVGDPPVPNTVVGVPGPFGRERVVFALPLVESELVRQVLLHDHNGSYIGDADGNIVGMPRVVVHRLVSARKVEDTRRL